MSRRSRFLVGLAAAAITFGSLFATMGPEKFNQCGKRAHEMRHCCPPRPCDNCCGDNAQHAPTHCDATQHSDSIAK